MLVSFTQMHDDTKYLTKYVDPVESKLIQSKNWI